MENLTRKPPAFSGKMGEKKFRVYDTDFDPTTGHFLGAMIFERERTPYSVEGHLRREENKFDFAIMPSMYFDLEIKTPIFFTMNGDISSGKTVGGRYGDKPDKNSVCEITIYKNFDEK